ncbi:catalase family peroxidase [Alteromonas sp. ASW11-36]|uniref:Catalase-related peroxidase n=1 Tax=Alteromonas arenosi TaxID=3055817 RepID=A0ABT7ST52_9ALTE|nr:catalase family peroxidase [Alteromonas sp. ASW11-36]MDM7859374.1 catalase family peroxidase [Alteromonas sp. ASW11-36]
MKRLLIGVAVSALSAVTLPSVAQSNTTAMEMVELFEKLSGKQPGIRKAHANGLCATANFVPNPAMSEYSSASIFTQETVPATIRFSMGSGNPSADQRASGARGMAIQLAGPNGELHNIVGNSTPIFAAKNPDVFFGLLQTLLPGENGQVDYAKVGQYIATHPSTQPLAQWQQTTNPPYSFGTSKFFGLHTFYFVNAQGTETMFRWHITPDAGERLITNEEKAALPAEFLNNHTTEQFNQDGISFTVTATIGQEGDTTNDPSQAWPTDRDTIEMGKITLTEIGGDACTPINFDPNVMASGFKASDDPVLRMRSPAYAISFGKRLSGQ